MARKLPAAVALGRRGGKVKSEAKALAARRNGKKGGRPKKVLMRAVLAVVVMLASSCSSPTAPVSPAVLEPHGRVIFDCYQGVCRFIGGAINHGSGCADRVHGVLTVRTPDGALFTQTPWSLPAERIITAGDSFSYSAPIQQDTFPVERTTVTTFNWRDIRCP